VRPLVAFIAALATLALALCPRLASAHEVGISRGEYTLDGLTLKAHLVFSQRELIGFAPALDVDASGALTAPEMAAGREIFEREVIQRIVVLSNGSPCPGTLVDAALLEGDGLAIVGKYACPARPAFLSVDLQLLEDMSLGHRHVAHVEAGTSVIDAVAHRRATRFDAPVGVPRATETAEVSSAPELGSVLSSFFTSGIEHILLGLDHLAFLFGLILLGGRTRALLTMITAFTVAHSITLALAVLGVWAPSPSIVEPAIALSVAYVGVENWLVKDGEKRWRITFPFGLVHGFGFAGALGQIELPSASIPPALVAFNLGVEAGQLAVLAVTLPIVLYARKSAWFRDKGVRALSLGLTVAGCVWFVLRVTGA
jgi:hydrogenase/urease accessory protein HupE